MAEPTPGGGSWARWALAAGVGVAAVSAGIALSPTARAALVRLRHLARPLAPLTPAVVEPDLPPGGVVAVPGRGELFVRDTGAPTGPTVLLLHGWGVTADVNFFTLYGPLARSYRVVALDHRGHGRGLRTPAPFTLDACADDAAALLDTIGAGPAIVVGYSMGGAVALELARRHPASVAGLVLVATALEWRQDRRDQALWRGLPVLEAVMRGRAGDGIVQRLLREAIEKEPSLDAYRSWLTSELRRGNVRDFIDAGRALSEFDAQPFAATIDAPAAVVVTTADRLVLPRKQRALAEALGATTFEIAGDHDAAVVEGTRAAREICAAVDTVALDAGLVRLEPRVTRGSGAGADGRDGNRRRGRARWRR